MRKIVMVVLLLVGIVMMSGTASAVEKSNSKAIIKTLITRIDSLQSETYHLRAVITAAMGKDSVPEEVRAALAGIPRQLDMMSSGLRSIKRQIKNGPALLTNDPLQREQLEKLSQIVVVLEVSFRRMRESVQEISGSYAV